MLMAVVVVVVALVLMVALVMTVVYLSENSLTLMQATRLADIPFFRQKM